MFQCCVISAWFCNSRESKSKAEEPGDGIDSPSLEVKFDATAGRAIAVRRGAGRIGHNVTPTLWLQRLVINGEIKMTRMGGQDKCADLGTKHLDFLTMNKHLKSCGMRFSEGRRKIAPHLEFYDSASSDDEQRCHSLDLQLYE